jgi:hypothetical protein
MTNKITANHQIARRDRMCFYLSAKFDNQLNIGIRQSLVLPPYPSDTYARTPAVPKGFESQGCPAIYLSGADGSSAIAGGTGLVPDFTCAIAGEALLLVTTRLGKTLNVIGHIGSPSKSLGTNSG